MSNHTPGPWEYEAEFSDYSEQGNDLCIYAGSIEIISGCGCCGSPTIRNRADANLIIAAPEILEALKNLVLQIEERHWGIKSPSQYETIVLKQARAAITKAEGRVMP